MSLLDSLRVLMINRRDAADVPGGDVVQLEKTHEGLERLGVSVEVRLADKLDGTWDYDLIHIFNIQSALDSWRACQVAKSKRLPVVLSTIYWDPTPAWYWTNPDLRMVWRVGRRLLRRWGYRPYAGWQRLRFRVSELWTVQRQLISASDLLLPNSNMEAAQVYRDFRLKPGNPPYRVVPNAVDRNLFEPPPERSSRIQGSLSIQDYVLEVGRISPEKNSLGLIKALWSLDIPLVFVGSASPYDHEYVDVCHACGRARGNTHFIDWLPHEELPGVYALAAAHALPSWRETPGLASLEAAAAGCPIVSTSIGSAREYFGDDAWYCHPADEVSIRKAVMSALKAPRSTTLRRRILEIYTWEAAAEATLAAYHTVLERRDSNEWRRGR